MMVVVGATAVAVALAEAVAPPLRDAGQARSGEGRVTEGTSV